MVSWKMPRQLWTLVAFAILSACSSGGGSGGSVSENPTSTNPPPSNTTPPGANTPTPAPSITGAPGKFLVQRDLSQSEAATHYDLGCKTPGQPGSKKAIDSRLKVGLTIKDRSLFTDPISTQSLELESTVTSVSTNQFQMTAKVLDVSFFGLAKGAKSQVTCTVVSDDKGDCTGGFAIQTTNAIVYMFVPVGDTTSTYQIGWYTLEDGVGRPAWRRFDTSPGYIFDAQSHSSLGHGQQTEENIYFLDIASNNITFCGGATAYFDMITSLDDGTQLNRMTNQVLAVSIPK